MASRIGELVVVGGRDMVFGEAGTESPVCPECGSYERFRGDGAGVGLRRRRDFLVRVISSTTWVWCGGVFIMRVSLRIYGFTTAFVVPYVPRTWCLRGGKIGFGFVANRSRNKCRDLV
jgi:hypothetical protein